jgi:hypothetical protein
MRYARFLIAACVLSCVWLAHAADRRKIATISYADFLDTSITKSAQFCSKEGVSQSFHSLRAQGFTDVYWRVSGEGHPLSSLYYFNGAAIDQMMAAAKEYANTPYAWDPYELRWPVEAAHREGLQFYAWIVPYNERAPAGSYVQLGDVGPTDTGYLYPQPHRSWPYIRLLKSPAGGEYYQTEFTWQSKFVHDHPEFQSIDRRQRRYHLGVLEWACPEARQTGWRTCGRSWISMR